jgi:D-3-phosphoglycerate dehydrogenase
MKLLHEGKAALVDFNDRVDAMFFKKYPTLRVIGSNTTGIEHIDFEEAESRGVKVFTLRGETEFLQEITSTAEHTIGLLLALARNYKRSLSGPYLVCTDYTGIKLRGKTLGVIGLGRIGKMVVGIAESLGMEPWTVDTAPWHSGVTREGLLAISDFISLHIPLEGNVGYFTDEMFSKMKPTAFLINTSRSGVIAPGALLRALKNKTIAGAAVDFIDDRALVEYAEDNENLILTPHIGGNTAEDRKLTEDFILQKIDAHVRDKEES